MEVDGKTASWSEIEKPRIVPRRGGAADIPDGDLVAGGVLGGDASLVSSIRWVLEETSAVDHVLVLPPDAHWFFTEGRDTAGDIAAAMIYAGAGRSALSDSGWDELASVVGDDLDDLDELDEPDEIDDEPIEGEFYPENAPPEDEPETVIY